MPYEMTVYRGKDTGSGIFRQPVTKNSKPVKGRVIRVYFDLIVLDKTHDLNLVEDIKEDIVKSKCDCVILGSGTQDCPILY